MSDSSAGRTFFYAVIGMMITLAVVFVIYQRHRAEQLQRLQKLHGAPSATTTAAPHR